MRPFVSEQPQGVVDGTNRRFRTSVPFRPSSMTVYLNGLCQPLAAWTNDTADRTVLVMTSAPAATDVLSVYYQPV